MLKLAFIYFIGVFIAAFALGTLRVLVIIPMVGEIPAVLLEIPIVLVISWTYFKYLITRKKLILGWNDLFLLGVYAFTYLMITEYVISIYLFQRTPTDYFDSLQTTHGLIGLLGQVGFALVPLLQSYLSTNRLNQK